MAIPADRPLAGRSSKDVAVFTDDVVAHPDHPRRLGIVTRVFGDSEGEESEDEEAGGEEDDTPLPDGHVRISWLTGDVWADHVPRDSLRVLDRSFLHGDIVAWAQDPLGMMGTVVAVELRVELERPGGARVPDVDSRLLRPVRPLWPGQYVVHGSWLGRVEDVLDTVTVAFDDGARCRLQDVDEERLEPVQQSPIDDEKESPYYPGQRVEADRSSLYRDAQWLHGAWRPQRRQGTVVQVEAGTVTVFWLAAGGPKGTHRHEAPPDVPAERMQAEDLVPLMYFYHTNWGLGDYTMPIPEPAPEARQGSGEDDSDGAPDDAAGEAAAPQPAVPRKKSKARSKKQKRRARRREAEAEQALLIVGTHTKVDVRWQDATLVSHCMPTTGAGVRACWSQGVEASSLVPVNHLGDHDFWPDEYVLQRTVGEEAQQERLISRAGLVKSVDFKQRTAVVQWMKQVSEPHERLEFEEGELVSVYELLEHPDYTYRLGDVVIGLRSASDAEGQPDQAQPDQAQVNAAQVDDVGQTEPKVDEDGRSSAPMEKDLSWVGEIAGLEAGEILVAWADGVVSKVGPQAIYVVSREDDYGPNEAGDDAASWETTDSMADPADNEREELHRIADMEALLNGGHSTIDNQQRVAGAFEAQGSLEPEPSAAGIFTPLSQATMGLASRLAGLAAGLVRKGEQLPGARSMASLPRRSSHGLEDLLTPDEGNGQAESSPSLLVNRSAPDAKHMVEGAVSASRMNGGLSQQLAGAQAAEEDLRTQPRDGAGIDDNTDNSGGQEMSAESSGTGHAEAGQVANGGSTYEHFDIVIDASDHHYVSNVGQITPSRKWSKKVQQEWASLQNSLPESIYVRAYEDRMDLLRAIIVGAPGTPYHNGLFVFDIFIPPDYPTVPPVSLGFCVHCFSIHVGGLVVQHFGEKAQDILRSCAVILGEEGGKREDGAGPSESSSAGLKIVLSKLRSKLREAFARSLSDESLSS
eukprot:SM000007S20813  [mRNA]  locus=s7:323315:328166:- [translate_table: standard]